jgi:outer membrane protein TolC
MASYWEYKAYKAGRLPSLTLRMTPIQYNRDFIRRYDSNNNLDVYREQQSLYSFGSLSVSQNLDLTGGTFFIDSQLGFFRNFGDDTYSQYSSVPIRVGYSQSLLGFNQFKWEKKVEPLKYERAKKQYIYSREEISESVIELFFNLAMARTEYDMALDNVASSDTLFNIGQERYKIASISQADMLTLKLDAINSKNTLKNSEVDLKKASFELSAYLNMDKEKQIRISLPEKPKSLTISAGQALQYAKDNNPDYLSNRQEILEAEREVERTKKSSAFDASFSASVGFNQVADNFSGAYKKPLQQDIISVGITIPLIDWGVRKGKVNMAKNNLNVSRLSIQQKEINLEQELIRTVSDFNIQQDLITSAEEAMELASMAYNITKQRFIIGKSDINSLTLSINRQKEARKNYIIALKNYWLSYYRIRKLTLFDFEENKPLSCLFDKMMNIY